MMRKRVHFHLCQTRAAFTLIEVLVSMTILTMLLLMLVQTTDAVRRTWTQTTGSVEQFREAREAYESMTRRITQATLNTYWDYDNPTKPTKYMRQSELRFISGPMQSQLIGTSNPNWPGYGIFFQAPLGYSENSSYAGLDSLLNTCGYYVEWGTDKDFWPGFMQNMPNKPERWRYRLMELMEPSELLTIYKFTSGNLNYSGHAWFITPFSAKRTRPIAENILYIRVIPIGVNGSQSFLLDSSTSLYDTSPGHAAAMVNQLPPYIQVSMMALDEGTFSRNQLSRNTRPPPWMGNIMQGGFSTGTANSEQNTIETALKAAHINYRLFITQIPIRGAKWTGNY
jgi:uncharacterized protein (TIGR02599 family)